MNSSRPLIIVCDWIPPAFGAVGQYALATARLAAAAGRPVTLIGLGDADEQEEIQPDAGLPSASEMTIIRLAARPAGKRSVVRRGLWALGVNFRLAARAAKALRRGDNAEIRVTGSPPFLAYLMILMNTVFLKRTLTYRITDFYPETAIAAGKGRILKPTVPAFHGLRRLATNIEALSECQVRRLVESGIKRSRVSIVRDYSPVRFSDATAPAERPFGKNDVVLLYSGNFGIAHETDTFLEAYRRHVHEGPNRVRLWLNATGAKVEKVVAFCSDNALPLHATKPVPLEELAAVLLAPDAHLVVLDTPFWGYVIPSKIYACIDSGKPVLYVGPPESDVHLLISARPEHVSIRNGDVDGCLAALNQLGMRNQYVSVAPEDAASPALECSQ